MEFSGKVVRFIRETSPLTSSEISPEVRGSEPCSETSPEVEGCGVFVTEEGLVLTLVTSRILSTHVMCSDGSKYEFELFYEDLDMNLSLVKIKNPSGLFNFAALYPPNSLYVGMPVICVGSLDREDPDLCSIEGEVSCTERKMEDLSMIFQRTKEVSDVLYSDYFPYLTRNDVYRFGESATMVELNNVFAGVRFKSFGSPVFDVSGQLIGLYCFIANGRSFAVHVDSIRNLLSSYTGGSDDIVEELARLNLYAGQ